MQPGHTAPGEGSAPPTGSPESTFIEQLALAVATGLGASCAFLERYTADPELAEVLGGSGEGVPPPGLRPRSARSLPNALLLPLVLDGSERGALVALGVPADRLSDPSLGAVLEPLARAGTLALRNHELEGELTAAAAAASERHFRLVSGTAHHLRDLLGVSSAYLQLLETETSLTLRQQEFVQSSRRNMELAVRLMAELLDLGRVETGRMALEWAPIQVRAVIRSMLKDYERAGLTHGIDVQLQHDDVLPVILSDFDMLHRVLDTLLSNAFRYSPPGSVVTVRVDLRTGRRAGDPGNWICVSVADRGPGVQQPEDVFEEIARVETSSSPGLRLAISRRLARLLGGDLTLESETGPGSTFTLWLPVTAPPPASPGSGATARPRARPGGRDRALT